MHRSTPVRSLVHSLECSIRNTWSTRSNNLHNFINSTKLVIKLSNQFVVDGSLIVPSSGLSSLIFLSISKILLSLGSEVSGLSNHVVGLVDLGSVGGNSLIALVKSLLADTHEGGESGELVLLILMSIGQGLMALTKDVIEHTENSLDSTLVGEVLGQSEHDSDHLSPFGSVGEVFQELLDVVLGFGNLYE